MASSRCPVLHGTHLAVVNRADFCCRRPLPPPCATSPSEPLEGAIFLKPPATAGGQANILLKAWQALEGAQPRNSVSTGQPHTAPRQQIRFVKTDKNADFSRKSQRNFVSGLEIDRCQQPADNCPSISVAGQIGKVRWCGDLPGMRGYRTDMRLQVILASRKMGSPHQPVSRMSAKQRRANWLPRQQHQSFGAAFVTPATAPPHYSFSQLSYFLRFS